MFEHDGLGVATAVLLWAWVRVPVCVCKGDSVVSSSVLVLLGLPHLRRGSRYDERGMKRWRKHAGATEAAENAQFGRRLPDDFFFYLVIIIYPNAYRARVRTISNSDL